MFKIYLPRFIGKCSISRTKVTYILGIGKNVRKLKTTTENRTPEFLNYFITKNTQDIITRMYRSVVKWICG